MHVDDLVGICAFLRRPRRRFWPERGRVHLPRRDAQFEPERVLERLRAAAKKRAEQEQLLFEQQASERRAAEEQAVEERQSLGEG
jgi:hypothetical protein